VIKGRNTEDWHTGDYNQSTLQPVFIYREKSCRFFRKFFKKGMRLLDIGCDDGSFSRRLGQIGYDVYGIDIRKKEVSEARQKGIKAYCCNAEKRLPFASGYFDAVYLGDVIEHIYDTDFIIGEAYRVMKKGGLFVVTTPNLASLSNRIRLLLGKLPIGSEVRLGKCMAGHIRNYTFPELEAQLKRHGFSIYAKVSSNIMFPVKYKLPLTKMAISLGDYFPNIGSHIIIAAKKE
jgi:SAM-dependent methyltransferase